MLKKYKFFLLIFMIFLYIGCGNSNPTTTCPQKTCPACPGKPTLPVINSAIVAKDVKAYWIDLALDKSYEPHISYYDADQGDLYYAYLNSKGDWVNEKVDYEGDVGMYSSIGIIGDMPVIAYYDYTYGRLKLAYKKNGIWNIKVIDNGNETGAWCDLAVDVNGMVNISYIDQNNHDLKFARWDTHNNVLVEELDDGITKSGGGVISNQTSIALDSLGNAHISYYDGYLGDLRYIYYEPKSGQWIKETIDDSPDSDNSQENLGSWNSIFLDKNDNPHIAYSDETNFRVKYAEKINGKWSKEIIETYDRADTFINLVMLGNEPVISYFDADYSDLRIAENVNSKWKFDIIDSVGIVGEYSKMVSGPTNRLYFAYRSYSNNQVLFKIMDTVK